MLDTEAADHAAACTWRCATAARSSPIGGRGTSCVRGGAELVARRFAGVDACAIDRVGVGFGRDVGRTPARRRSRVLPDGRHRRRGAREPDRARRLHGRDRPSDERGRLAGVRVPPDRRSPRRQRGRPVRRRPPLQPGRVRARDAPRRPGRHVLLGDPTSRSGTEERGATMTTNLNLSILGFPAVNGDLEVQRARQRRTTVEDGAAVPRRHRPNRRPPAGRVRAGRHPPERDAAGDPPADPHPADRRHPGLGAHRPEQVPQHPDRRHPRREPRAGSRSGRRDRPRRCCRLSQKQPGRGDHRTGLECDGVGHPRPCPGHRRADAARLPDRARPSRARRQDRGDGRQLHAAADQPRRGDDRAAAPDPEPALPEAGRRHARRDRCRRCRPSAATMLSRRRPAGRRR